MAFADLLVVAAPWVTLAFGVRAGVLLERRRRDRELDRLLSSDV